MRLVAMAVGVFLGVGGCGDGPKQAAVDAGIDVTIVIDPLVHCQFPTQCGDAAPYCCVGYSPGGAFEGSMCSPSKCYFATCDPDAAQPCAGSGVCEQVEGYGDGRKWWTCQCGNGMCPP